MPTNAQPQSKWLSIWPPEETWAREFPSSAQQRLILFHGATASVIPAGQNFRMPVIPIFSAKIDAVGWVGMSAVKLDRSYNSSVFTSDGVPLKVSLTVIVVVMDSEQSISTVALFGPKYEEILLEYALKVLQQQCVVEPYSSLGARISELSNRVKCALAVVARDGGCPFAIHDLNISEIAPLDEELASLSVQRAKAREKESDEELARESRRKAQRADNILKKEQLEADIAARKQQLLAEMEAAKQQSVIEAERLQNQVKTLQSPGGFQLLQPEAWLKLESSRLENATKVKLKSLEVKVKSLDDIKRVIQLAMTYTQGANAGRLDVLTQLLAKEHNLKLDFPQLSDPDGASKESSEGGKSSEAQNESGGADSTN